MDRGDDNDRSPKSALVIGREYKNRRGYENKRTTSNSLIICEEF